jgi:hypothetical protein
METPALMNDAALLIFLWYDYTVSSTATVYY